MDEILNVYHLAPVIPAPRRGRGGRLAYAEVSTPVRPVSVEAREMPKVGRLGGGAAVHAHAGSLWVPAGHATCDGLFRSLPLSRPSGPGGPASPERLPERLVGRSPLQAWHDGPPPALASGALAHDGRERAREDLAAYLDGNLRTCRGEPYIRIRGPLVGPEWGEDGLVMRFQPAPFPEDPADLSVAPSRVPAALAALHRNGEPQDREPPVVGLVGLPFSEGTEDALLFLCRALGTVPQRAREAARRPAVREAAPALAADADALEQARGLASFGAIRDGEMADLLLAVTALAREVGRASKAAGLGKDDLVRRTLLHAKTVFGPAVLPPPEPEDEAAMQGLSF